VRDGTARARHRNSSDGMRRASTSERNPTGGTIMKIAGASGAAALLGILALSAVACDRATPSAKDAGLAASSKDAGYLAQYVADAGYGMPNPQPGSPISPTREAGIAPPPPSPSAPIIPYAPSSPVPLNP
jgi:hypothetical protein